MCQITYTKSVYLQIYTDFCPWYFQTIKSDRLHHSMSCVRHLPYTNWRLKICMWHLYFSSWSPEGNLRIFLILSPVLWNLKLLKFVFPAPIRTVSLELFHITYYITLQKECNDWNYSCTRLLSTENKKLLNLPKDSILIQSKRFIVKNSLRKHLFFLALHCWGRFARETSSAAKSEEKRMFSQAKLRTIMYATVVKMMCKLQRYQGRISYSHGEIPFSNE